MAKRTVSCLLLDPTSISIIRPFIDDLKVEITDNGVEVRSSSRVGESDFGVNQKRLAYLGQGLAAAGWTVPEPKY